jgi:hypothetical protein
MRVGGVSVMLLASALFLLWRVLATFWELLKEEPLLINSFMSRLTPRADFEQVLINGKPDFIMPSYDHFKENPIDCIIFTAKRTLRERWRQIVTEGTRGLGFFLATIDEDLTSTQLAEMHNNRIYIVCPQSIKDAKYSDKINVLSFTHFYKDFLDPAMERWRRNHVI